MAAITITGSDPITGNLTLSDHGSTNAGRGEKVTWVIGPKSGVESITDINAKYGSINVFDPLPAKLGHSSNWQGVIKTELEIPAVEEYFIKWKDDAGKSHEYDPQIKVNR